MYNLIAKPLEFFYGGEDLLEKVEEALAEQGTGFHAVLHLEPEHAFGDYDPALVFFESNADLPEGMEAPGFYQPVRRGLEIRIGEKLAELRRRNREAAGG